LEKEVAQTRSPRLIVESWQWATYPLDNAPESLRFRTWCGIPIHFSGGAMGVLTAANFERERAISEGQFELIQVLANEAAGAFENARVFQAEQRRARHLALLNEIGRKATSVLNPKELLQNICDQVRIAFGYEWARIETADCTHQELVVEAEAGYGEPLRGHRTRWGEGLSGIAAESGQPVLANSALGEPRYVALDPGVRSSLSLPLSYHDELLGVLSLESRREHAFAPQDMHTLKALADQLSIALHNARAYQYALEEAITDGLTGLKTHRYFMEAIEREWRHSSRSGRSFSVIMMDLDRFKLVNDQHGHLQGDRVLRTVAHLLKDRVRQSCVLARYGGDEFSILLPDATTKQAEVLGERLRTSIEQDPFLATYRVTSSLGIGTFPEHASTHEGILHTADAGMYLAKHEQGNRVRVAQATPDSSQVEAYLGVEFKRMFSTGPEAFNQILNRIEKALKSEGEVPLVNTVTSLARAIDFSDHYTRYHGQAVSRLAVQIARQLGLSEQEIEEIRRAGILHDIGKIGIPDIILKKPGRLTPEEYTIMKTHSVKGQRILEPLKVEAFQRICLMVRHHHEMFEGRGYPDQLKSENIPLGARILTVADCFDTMVSERAYKKALTHEEGIAELHRCSGTQFDPKLVKAFLASLEIYGDPRLYPSQDKEEDVRVEEIVI
jgi:diguanylate cyclase (GGDEF)-like protein/putative nucleotidyltransferase with HDIG domain